MIADRVRGSFVGLALGDALGAPHELRSRTPLIEYTGRLTYPVKMFNRYTNITKFDVIGSVTDDTEMTLALANSIIRQKGYHRNDVILSYQKWANSGIKGMGVNTAGLFKGVTTIRGYTSRYNKVKDNNVQSNGSLMRCLPLALLDEQYIAQDCALTNPNQINQQISSIYCNTIRLLWKGATVEDCLDYIRSRMSEIADDVILLAYSDAIQDKARDITKQKGWVVHAFYCVIYALVNYKGSYSAIIDQIIRKGGDTDTNAAIAGGVIGALPGAMDEEITRSNLEILLTADPSMGDYPRPELYLARTIPRVVEELLKL